METFTNPTFRCVRFVPTSTFPFSPCWIIGALNMDKSGIWMWWKVFGSRYTVARRQLPLEWIGFSGTHLNALELTTTSKMRLTTFCNLEEQITTNSYHGAKHYTMKQENTFSRNLRRALYKRFTLKFVNNPVFSLKQASSVI